MSGSRRRLLLVFALLLPLSGCLTWSPAGMSAEALILQPEPPERVRVTTRAGDQLVLESPVIRAGALVATAAPGAAMIEDVVVLEVEKVSVTRTLGLTLPGALILAIVGLQACRCL